MFTFIFTESFPLQPLIVVEVTVYLVSMSGVAMGLAQFAQLNPVAGLQEKLLPPVANNGAGLP